MRVFGGETRTRKAISKAISGARNGYLLCKCLMLCGAIGALGRENDTAGFELPIPYGGFKTADCYSVERRPRQKHEMAGPSPPSLLLAMVLSAF
jgi:hypothetical protein